MRILHISTRLILGGSQENTVLSCEGQVRRGHEVHLAFGPIYGPEGSLLERVEQFGVRGTDGGGEQAIERASEQGKIHTHNIPNLVREINPIKDRRALRELRELIERIKPDVVHTHSSKAGILGRWAAWGSPAGVVHTIHGPPFMPIEGSAPHRLKVRALNYAYTLAERSAARHCHTIVSVADAMTREFLRRGIGTPEQYTTVRSGMEIERFLTPTIRPDGTPDSRENVRAMLALKPDDFVIGTVARLAQHKGHDDLLDALAHDLRQHPNWKLLWVGDGWWRERLLNKAAVLQITHASAHTPGGTGAQLILTGLVPPERIPGLLRAMDLLVHPSSREGLPRTVPQALLSGVPVVAYDCDGTGEVCRDMDTGRLVKTGDTQALGDAIRWMAEHPDERRAMAERGKDMCVREFSAEKMVDDLERIYVRALHRARG
jgi:glycosyltransferase involved in cell wall biosynthesis